ncbi:MAG: pyruvate formate lyase family protein, partial [Oscillospiraceae bacterium]
MEFKQWESFKVGKWNEEINVSEFIKLNYCAYEGSSDFLSDATKRTRELMIRLNDLFLKERENGGVLDIDTTTVSSLTHYKAGYLDKEKELIVGLQTDSPLKRGVNPFGGIRMARSAVEAYGYKLSDKIEEEFRFKTTHNDGVFRAYTEEMRKARHMGMITGLPDAYGRGRIIGDY